jgi:hypothetical protein
MRFMVIPSFFCSQTSLPEKWANDAGADVVRTWGIAGEPLTARQKTGVSRSAALSGRRRVDGAKRGPTGACYKISSCLCPQDKGWRLIHAKKRGQKAPQA